MRRFCVAGSCAAKASCELMSKAPNRCKKGANPALIAAAMGSRASLQ